MKTLKLEFEVFGDVIIKITGLSFKKVQDKTILHTELCRHDYSGEYYISTDFNGQLNNQTANIKKEYLIKVLRELYSVLPFDRIKIDGAYELTEQELMTEVLKKE